MNENQKIVLSLCKNVHYFFFFDLSYCSDELNCSYKGFLSQRFYVNLYKIVVQFIVYSKIFLFLRNEYQLKYKHIPSLFIS